MHVQETLTYVSGPTCFEAGAANRIECAFSDAGCSRPRRPALDRVAAFTGIYRKADGQLPPKFSSPRALNQSVLLAD